MRVVIDTNVLVSGIAYPNSGPGRIVSLWHQGSLDVVLSRYILDELIRVLPRLPRIRRTSEQIRALVEGLGVMAEIFEPSWTQNPGLRDPADQPILALLLQSRAEYLITGDKDLIALADTHPIITPSTFWTMQG